ncbi:MAG: hypothetical protein ABI304_04030 [Rudaea sp.]
MKTYRYPERFRSHVGEARHGFFVIAANFRCSSFPHRRESSQERPLALLSWLTTWKSDAKMLAKNHVSLDSRLTSPPAVEKRLAGMTKWEGDALSQCHSSLTPFSFNFSRCRALIAPS